MNSIYSEITARFSSSCLLRESISSLPSFIFNIFHCASVMWKRAPRAPSGNHQIIASPLGFGMYATNFGTLNSALNSPNSSRTPLHQESKFSKGVENCATSIKGGISNNTRSLYVIKKIMQVILLLVATTISEISSAETTGSNSVTYEQIASMRRASVQIKETLDQRYFSEIRSDISPEEFMNSFGLTFRNLPSTGMPSFLFSMPNLRELDLANTGLTTEEVAKIGDLTQLEKLDISGNPIELGTSEAYPDDRYTWKNTIGKLHNLKILTFSNGENTVMLPNPICYLHPNNNGSFITKEMLHAEDKFTDNDGYTCWRRRFYSNDLIDVHLHELHIIESTSMDVDKLKVYDSMYAMNFAWMPLVKLSITNFNNFIGPEGIGRINICDNFDVTNLVYLKVGDMNERPYLNGFAPPPKLTLGYCDFPRLEVLDISGADWSSISYDYFTIWSLPNLRTLIVDENQPEARRLLCFKFPDSEICN